MSLQSRNNKVWWRYIVEATSEDVPRQTHEIVVDETAIEGTDTHQQEQVPGQDESLKIWILTQFIGILHHEDWHDQKKTTMANIAKHDSEHEREEHHSKETRVYLLIARDTVGVDNLLEWPSELIDLEVGRSHQVIRRNQFDDLNRSHALFAFAERLQGLVQFELPARWAPEETSVDGMLQVQQVEVCVDGLLPEHQ